MTPTQLHIAAILAFVCFANCVKVDLPPMPAPANNSPSLLSALIGKKGLLDNLLGIVLLNNIDPSVLQDSTLKTYDLIRKYGYPVEIHRMTTSDGYVLEMHRIPGSDASPPAEGKPVVYMQHGILDSSAGWILMGPENGLPYLLADRGYDVWLGNVRGNTYSRKHVIYNPDGSREERRRFWSFSWHEMGVIDLPTMIDYISEETGQQQMHYIGHSQGTTVFFVMASTVPEYNDRIISMNALAPIAYMSNLKSPLARSVAFFLKTFEYATSVLGMYEFLPNNEIITALGQTECYDTAPFQPVCGDVLFLVFGFDSAQLNETMLPVILGHTPAGASTNQIIHYAQNIRSGLFSQFDHGAIGNMAAYNSTTPPLYNTSAITAPISLHYADNDWLAAPVDVLHFKSEVGSIVGTYEIADPKFNHIDFLWAIDAYDLAYQRVIDILSNID